MSRRILGIDPTLHEGQRAVRIAVYPGSLTRAEGRIPLPGSGWADVSWRRDDEGLLYNVNSAADWILLKSGATVACRAGNTEVRLSAKDCAFTT
jgi:hypothetical protein